MAAYPGASAKNARDFLRTPFEVKAIQVDGGRTGFAGEAACQELGPPCSPPPKAAGRLKGPTEFYDYRTGEQRPEAARLRR